MVDAVAGGFGVRRRTLARGFAWSTPVVLAVQTAPAFAASLCTGPNAACPDLSFGTAPSDGATTAGNGWSWTANNNSWLNPGNPLGFYNPQPNAPFNDKGTYFSATREPNSAGRVITLTQSGQPALLPSCSYTISFGVIVYADLVGSADTSVDVLVGGVQIGAYLTTGLNGVRNQDQGIKSFRVPTGLGGVVSFRVTYAGTGVSDDVHIYRPKVTCS